MVTLDDEGNMLFSLICSTTDGAVTDITLTHHEPYSAIQDESV